jgi:hypothetical protein
LNDEKEEKSKKAKGRRQKLSIMGYGWKVVGI